MAGPASAPGPHYATKPPPRCTAPATADGRGCWTRSGPTWTTSGRTPTSRWRATATPSKGLTGTGYDGHAFWDTEGYVLPVLTYTLPHAVADSLRWRASTLELARERAAEL